MYAAQNISFHSGGKSILKEVNLMAHPGELTAIVGPNGAGKSSLVKILAHEQEQYSGTVTVNGKATRHYSAKELSRIRAVMPQSSTVQFGFSVAQIIALGRYAHTTTQRENEIILDEVCRLAGITSLCARSYPTLSGGEKQRVQLARVIAQVWDETAYPKYILLDEPTANMDIAQQQFMLSLAKRLCSRNIGVLAIVHDLNLAVRFADAIYFMRDGEIVASGESSTVFTKAIIEETFCCAVNIYRDPSNNCPYIIPEGEFAHKGIMLKKSLSTY